MMNRCFMLRAFRGAGLSLIAALISITAPAYAAGSGSSSKPVDPQESYQKCLKHLKDEEFRRASRECRKALKKLAKDADVNYAMALAEIGRERFRSAQEYLETAVENRAGFVKARVKLAKVCLERDKEECAREQLEALEKLLADCTDCSDERKQEIEAAIAAVKAALDGEDSAAFNGMIPEGGFAMGDRFYQASVGLINAGKYQQAIDSLYRAKSASGPHPDILNYLGFAHRKLGRYDDAKRYYHQALALDPDHKGATEYLGELHLELGNVAQAKKLLAKLDRLCTFGCAEREDLAMLIAAREDTAVQ